MENNKKEIETFFNLVLDELIKNLAYNDNVSLIEFQFKEDLIEEAREELKILFSSYD